MLSRREWMQRTGVSLLLVAALPAVEARRGRGEAEDDADDRRGRGGGRRGRIRREVRLNPTALGRATRTRGKARIEARPDREREKFQVEVESRGLAVGTPLRVFVLNPAAGPDPVAAADLVLTPNPRRPVELRAELELESESAALPAGVSPVTGITEIRVIRSDTGELLLTSARP